VNHLLPTSLRLVWEVVPADPAVFHGPLVAEWITAAWLVIVTARSLVHIFAPDGGARSIATIDTSVAGGPNIVGLFGQWGAVQLLLAGLLWVLLIRYPGIIPLILTTLLAEPFLRRLSARLKPIETQRTAPGARFNWVAVPILAGALLLALCPA
jgi:hypothetical protein